MNYKLLVDKKKRLSFKKNELKQLSMKVLFRLCDRLNVGFCFKLVGLSKSIYVTRLRNRCFITGRSRAVFSKFRVSRIKLREMCLNGFTKLGR